jgi:hypothetical protein
MGYLVARCTEALQSEALALPTARIVAPCLRVQGISLANHPDRAATWRPLGACTQRCKLRTTGRGCPVSGGVWEGVRGARALPLHLSRSTAQSGGKHSRTLRSPATSPIHHAASEDTVGSRDTPHLRPVVVGVSEATDPTAASHFQDLRYFCPQFLFPCTFRFLSHLVAPATTPAFAACRASVSPTCPDDCLALSRRFRPPGVYQDPMHVLAAVHAVAGPRGGGGACRAAAATGRRDPQHRGSGRQARPAHHGRPHAVGECVRCHWGRMCVSGNPLPPRRQQRPSPRSENSPPPPGAPIQPAAHAAVPAPRGAVHNAGATSPSHMHARAPPLLRSATTSCPPAAVRSR